MDSWFTVLLRCPHGYPVSVNVYQDGRITLPSKCAHEEPSPPSRFRIWWATRKARRSLKNHPDL